MFAVPTYAYIVSLVVLLVVGLTKSFFGDLGRIPVDPARLEEISKNAAFAQGASLFLLMRAFSSGAVALTGVEAISNGVSAFKKPESKNASTTLVWMAAILGSLFFGVSVLAHRLHPIPSEHETVLSQVARQVYGGSGVMYWIMQVTTFAILILAANTAFADFPRLSSILAKDRYLPRQFANRGDRLVFSNGVLILAVFAGLLDRRLRRQDQRTDPAVRGRRVRRVHPVAGGHGGTSPQAARAGVAARRGDQRRGLRRDLCRGAHHHGDEVHQGRVGPDGRHPDRHDPVALDASSLPAGGQPVAHPGRLQPDPTAQHRRRAGVGRAPIEHAGDGVREVDASRQARVRDCLRRRPSSVPDGRVGTLRGSAQARRRAHRHRLALPRGDATACWHSSTSYARSTRTTTRR